MNWSKKQVSILLIISITSFMGTFLISSVNVALPAIEKTFSMNAVSLSWVVTSFLLATAMFLLPVGRLGDISGVAKLYKIGLIIFTVASLGCAIAPSGGWFIFARYLQGVGSAFTNTTGQAILISSFLPQHRGRVIGVSVSSVYLGLSFGPFIGGMLTQQVGWHSIFYASALLGLISMVVAFLYLDKDEKSTLSTQKLSFKGVLFFIIGLLCLVYGSSQIPSVAGWLIMAGGILSLIIFWKVESKAEAPVIDLTLYTKNKMFAYSNLAALINYCATAAIIFFMSLYLQKVKLLSPQQAGLVLIAQPIVMALFSPLVGLLSDRIQPRFFATLGMGMCSIGLGALAFLTADTPQGIIIAILLWMGLGFALFSSPNMNIIMSSVNRSQYGQASGSAASMRVIGQIISMTVVTLLFAGLFNGRGIEEVTNRLFLTAMKWGFIIFAAIGTVGVYFSVIRGNVKR